MRFCRQGPSLVVDAPAKLNLFLEVRGKRPDGYHELETLMVSIGLFDTLRLTPAPRDIALVSVVAGASREPLPATEDNHVVRAARLLAAETGCARGVHIELTKRIPLAAGMGGGSSDAAATLAGLNRLWQTGLSADELQRLAARLGSDVNFFLDSDPLAVCRGRGEQVMPVWLARRLHFVIARPDSGLSTSAVFAACRGPAGTRSPDHLLRALAAGSTRAVGRELYNALERPARELSNDVGEVMGRLGKCGAAGYAMTGSGSACFALCGSRRHAERIGAALRSAMHSAGGPRGRVWTVRSGA